MVQQLRASGPGETALRSQCRGRASVSAVLSQLASCKTLAASRLRDNSDGQLRLGAFEALQADLDRVCPGCGALRDACAVVAANVTAGAHAVSVVVAPKSFADPEMHVAISQLMVV